MDLIQDRAMSRAQARRHLAGTHKGNRTGLIDRGHAVLLANMGWRKVDGEWRPRALARYPSLIIISFAVGRLREAVYNKHSWGCTGFDGKRSIASGKPGRFNPVNNEANFKCQPH